MVRIILIIGLALLLLAQQASPPAAHAQGDAYELSWGGVAGGGGASAGEQYRLLGVPGQPDAGLAAGGDYQLAGGMFGGGATRAALHPQQYLPLLRRP